jgi:hypothetical protein
VETRENLERRVEELEEQRAAINAGGRFPHRGICRRAP